MRTLWNNRNPNYNKKIEEDSEDECYLLPEECKEDMLKHGKIVGNPRKNMENPRQSVENPRKIVEKDEIQNPFLVAFHKGIQKQTGNGISTHAVTGIQNHTGNDIYDLRWNSGLVTEIQIHQSDQFEINTDIGQVEKRRVRFNPNVEGHLIAFENVNEK